MENSGTINLYSRMASLLPFFSQIYTNGAILSIFFYFSTPFLYACVFGMGLFFSAREAGNQSNPDSAKLRHWKGR